MSHQARAAFRPPSPSSLPKRRATLSARRELWLRGGDSSDEDPRYLFSTFCLLRLTDGSL